VLWAGGPNTARDFYVQFAADQDGDGVQAADDNCDRVANPRQADFNNDGVGDACQNSDGDGLNDDVELQTGTDPSRTDTDGDGYPDGVIPPPPPPPTNCHQWPPGPLDGGGGCDMTSIECDPLPETATFSVPGFGSEIDDARNGRLHVSYNGSVEHIAEVSVCARNLGGESCSEPFAISISGECRRGTDIPEDLQCPGQQVRCRGSGATRWASHCA
jgi:hypothetical protein